MDDLLVNIIPLAVDHKLLNIPPLNTEHDTIHVQRKIIIGKLQPIEIEDIKVSDILWTKDDTDTVNSPVELQSMPPESFFQPEHNNTNQSIVLQDGQMQQEAKDKISSLLTGDYNCIVSKSPMDVGRTNLFQMDIQTAGPPISCKLCPVSLKYQRFVCEEIRLLENARCVHISVSPWATPVIIVPKKASPLNAQQQQLHLVLDYQSLNKSINAVHNDNNVISYYPLPKIRDLLARFQSAPYFPH